MTLSSVIIFATLILFTVADPQCGAGEQVCNDATMGPTCYDPSIYSCPSGSRGSILCGYQEHGPDAACGTICYDFHEYQCCNEQLYELDASTPCASTSAPTSSPTSPATSAPTSGPTSPPTGGTQPATCGSQTCLSGDSCCDDVRMGPTCYDPSLYTCPVGSSGPVLCGNQENGPDAACGTTCYDFHEYQCCNDQLYGMDEDTPCSPSNPTSAPTGAPTSAPGTQAPPVSVTSAPTSAPGATCGSQSCSDGFGCCDDVTMGPTCYDMSLYTCPVGSQGPVLCGNQEHGPDGACGTICYDMVDYQCCNDQLYGAGEDTPCSSNPTSAPTSAPGTQAPPVSETSAPTAAPTCNCAPGLSCCDDVTLGSTCYDAGIYTCPVGSQGPILCGNQEHGPDGACGTTCYDMTDYKCCNDQLYGADDDSAPC